MDGIKSMNVWVMDMATIKTAREMRENCWKYARDETRTAETRLMWIPGDMPVIVPARQPRRIARNSSRIIFS